MTDDRAPGLLTKREEDALAYVDKCLDNIEDLDSDLIWTNAEVVDLLEDIRSILLTGEVTPGAFIPESAERCSMCRDGVSHSARCHHDEHEVCDRVAEGTDAPKSCACPCHSPAGRGSDDA